MTKQQLIEALEDYPDKTPVMISIQVNKVGDFSCLKYDFTSVQNPMGKTKYIELMGFIDD